MAENACMEAVMTKSKHTKKTTALYLRRLLEDERIHAHVADASARLRKAYRRAAGQPGAKAAEDRQIYDHVREAVASLGAAARILRRAPPQKPKRRARTPLLLAVLAVGGVLLAKRASGRTERRNHADRPAEPVEPGRHDDTTAQPPVAEVEQLRTTREQ
jgi:hypothetical protein